MVAVTKLNISARRDVHKIRTQSS